VTRHPLFTDEDEELRRFNRGFVESELHAHVKDREREDRG
jgi:hypothetical protein